MITQARELFPSPQSHFFVSAVKRCGLAEHHYREREFIISGTARLYETGEDGRPRVRYADCRYADRMFVRQPDDCAHKSGRGVVEIVNSTADFDIDRIWAESYRYLMRQGDIFVGITSKPNVFAALRRFDAARYRALDWPNPSQKPVRKTIRRRSTADRRIRRPGTSGISSPTCLRFCKAKRRITRCAAPSSADFI